MSNLQIKAVKQEAQPDDLSPTIRASLENGDRLVEDARWLLDLDRYASAYALSILAQEEYAKAFLLHLVQTGAIPWNSDVRRTLRDHTCKQLVGTIMDYMQPDWDDFLVRLEERKQRLLPPTIADAMNIIRHEKVSRDRDSTWIWDDNTRCDRQARKIANGHLDKQKQDSVYVGVGKTGRVTSTPLRIEPEEAKREFEKSDRLGRVFSRPDANFQAMMTLEYEIVFESFRLLFGFTTVEEYNKHWWA